MITLLLTLLLLPSAWAGEAIKGADSYGNVACPGFSNDPKADARIKEYCKHRFDADAVAWADRMYTDSVTGPQRMPGYAVCAEMMEQAMRAMEPYLPSSGYPVTSFEDTVFRPCDFVCQAKKTLAYEEAKVKALEQWNDAKRECWRQP